MVCGGSRIKNTKILSQQKRRGGALAEALPLSLGEIRLPESARGRRTATENGARNNPRRNNATRQIVSVEISLLDVCLVKNPIVVQFLECKIIYEILFSFSDSCITMATN